MNLSAAVSTYQKRFVASIFQKDIRSPKREPKAVRGLGISKKNIYLKSGFCFLEMWPQYLKKTYEIQRESFVTHMNVSHPKQFVASAFQKKNVY